MYHSITFGDKNTWDDWHLIPATRPTIPPPSINEKIVSIPGADGSVDLTNLLTGYPTFQNRSGSWNFFVLHEYWPDWVACYTTLMHELHGKTMRVILEDDPGFYYEGRITVGEYKPASSYSSIQIGYSFYPYKKAITSTSDEWLWDTLNFYDGVIYDCLSNVTVNGEATVTIEGIGEQRVIPTITCSAPMTVVLNNLKTFNLSTGANQLSRLKISPGSNTLKFTGNGTVTVDYRGGVL